MAIDLNIATNVTINLVATAKEQLIKVNDAVSIIVKDGTTINLFLSIEQSLKSFKDNPKAATVKNVTLISSGIIINYNHENVIRLKNIVLSKGGKAEVKEYEALQTAKNLEGIESLVILVSLLSRTHSQYERYGVVKRENNFESTVIKGLTLSELNSKISEAVIKIIKEKKDSIGGFDLAKAFGVK